MGLSHKFVSFTFGFYGVKHFIVSFAYDQRKRDDLNVNNETKRDPNA